MPTIGVSREVVNHAILDHIRVCPQSRGVKVPCPCGEAFLYGCRICGQRLLIGYSFSRGACEHARNLVLSEFGGAA